MKTVKRLNPKSSHCEKDLFFNFFNVESMQDDGCSPNLLYHHFMMYGSQITLHSHRTVNFISIKREEKTHSSKEQ